MNCAEYLVDFLIQKGVTDIFGYAGGYITPFMDALCRRDEITVHVCYNEQGCAFAANGYARVTGKIGVYFTTSGPGAINALGGLADAWFDSIPLMGISGNVNTYEMKCDLGIRQLGFQEMDIASVTASITKYTATPISSEEFPEIISKAYETALSGRKGGVVIDFPYDIQKAGIYSR